MPSNLTNRKPGNVSCELACATESEKKNSKKESNPYANVSQNRNCNIFSHNHRLFTVRTIVNSGQIAPNCNISSQLVQFWNKQKILKNFEKIWNLLTSSDSQKRTRIRNATLSISSQNYRIWIRRVLLKKRFKQSGAYLKSRQKIRQNKKKCKKNFCLFLHAPATVACPAR